MEAALRLARAMYVMLDDGMSKEAALEMRKECYAKVKSNAHPGPGGSLPASSTADADALPQQQEAATSSDMGLERIPSSDGPPSHPKSDIAALEADASGHVPSASEIEECLPPDVPVSRLHSRIKWRDEGRPRACCEVFHPIEGKIHFQVKVADVGSAPVAERLLRSCVAMLQDGQPKRDVELVRKRSIAKLQQKLFGVKQADAPAQASPSAGPTPGLDLLDPLPDDFVGASHIRYRSKGTGHSAYFVFHWGEPREQLQVTFSAVNGWRDLAWRIICLLYTRIEAGETKEQALQYRKEMYSRISGVPVNPHPEEGQPPQQAPSLKRKPQVDQAAEIPQKKRKEAGRDPKQERTEAKKRSSDAPEGTNSKAAKKKGPGEKTQDSSSDSDSDGSDSSDDSSDASSSDASAGAAGASPRSRGVDGQGAASPPGSVKPAPKPKPRIMPRAVAKVMVRSGLRCSCHFTYVWRCPNRKPEDGAQPAVEVESTSATSQAATGARLNSDRDRAAKPRSGPRTPEKPPARVDDRVADPATPAEWAAKQHLLFAGMPELRKGWIRIRSKSKGDLFYYNTTTGESVYEEPLKR